MKLSLTKYCSGKAEMKFGNTWIKHDNTLMQIASITDYANNHVVKHVFNLTLYPEVGNWGKESELQLDHVEVVDDVFEDIWSKAELFPKEGMINMYNPFTGTFIKPSRIKYIPNANEGKYKRAAYYESYALDSLVGSIPNNGWKSALQVAEQELLKSLSISSSKAWLHRVITMNSLYFPRYDFVNWRLPETVKKFFEQDSQLILSPTLRAIKCDGCIILFNKFIAIAIYSKDGFMIKEDPALIYKKDLLLADIPFNVYKRLQRSKTFMV